MSPSSAVSTNNSPKSDSHPVKLPPEPRFWKKYSPHHEFPVSTVASVVVHALAVGVIILGAVLMARIGFEDKPPEVDGLEIGSGGDVGGGGGNPLGAGFGPNNGVLPQTEKTEQVNNDTPPSPTPPSEQLKPLDVKPPDLKVEAPTEDSRAIEETAVVASLSDIGKQAREKIEAAIAGKGKGGTGSGGGQGSGVGSGTGSKSGPGTGTGGSGKMTQRQKRQLRWVMMFNTRDGNDYARQLHDLGAILAVPQANGEYVLYRDLSRRPAHGQVEDIKGLDRIFWIDDKPQSVYSLSTALGISPVPSHIAAFFPQELEKDLLSKELAFFKARHRSGTENDIKETRFQVLPAGGRYEPKVVFQVP